GCAVSNKGNQGNRVSVRGFSDACHCERSESPSHYALSAAMEIAAPGLGPGVAALLTLNRGLAPSSWRGLAGLAPPSTSSFSRVPQDVDGRPPAFTGACSAGHDDGARP